MLAAEPVSNNIAGTPVTADQIILFSLLAAFFGLLMWGRYRYDLVAFAALVIGITAGVIPGEEAFSGFGHPATVIIALVLIISHGLSASGAIDLIARPLMARPRAIRPHLVIMTTISSLFSALMNNVAALALLMPIDIQAAAKAKRSPSLTLMPLSFATILGGMVTLIGTPPNIVIATFRQEALGAPYQMFDFAPVGLAVTVGGVLFVALVGWRLLPADRTRHDARAELKDLKGYIVEASVPEESGAVGKRLRELYPLADENDVSVLGLIRRGKRLRGAAMREVVRDRDFIVVEGGPESVSEFLKAVGLEHAGAAKHSDLVGETLALSEVVVPEGARIERRSALDVRLAYRHGVHLLGVSRQGRRFRDRVRKLPIRAGDILLLLGPEERLPSVVGWMGCLPLASRGLQVKQPKKARVAIGVFIAAIFVASLGLLYLPVALAVAAVLFVLLRIVPLSQLYHSIEWPVVVLLGSLIPIGIAVESSGGTALMARTIVDWTQDLPPWVVLTVLMIITMTLSDLLNNVATALIAAPIGLEIAARVGANPDAFLMAVAVACSCAFLTPIGHKNNTIIMGPGGYRFGDYWRMGLPLEILVVCVSVPAILWFWPL